VSGLRFLVLALLIAACGRSVDTTWQEGDGHRWRALDVPRRGTPGFNLLDPSRTGVTFANTVSDSLLVRNRILAQGGGVCFGDVDGDGLVDVFLARTEGPNALYRNLGGWRFEEIAQSAGVGAPDRYSTGCAFADVDGDRDLDLILVAIGGPNALFLNDGTGRFTEQGEEAGLKSSAGSTTIAAADVNGDGWLDLYIANYKAYTTLDHISPQERAFDQVVRQLGPRRYEVRERYRRDYRVVDREDLGGISLEQRADPDLFYRNAGGGRFIREPIARNPRFVDEQGRPLAEEPEAFGLAAMFADLDGDGAPDLYVANDISDNAMFRNLGNGKFEDISYSAWVADYRGAMGLGVGDYDRDGDLDIYVTHWRAQENALYWNLLLSHEEGSQKGPLRFTDVADMMGLGQITLSVIGWGTSFFDYDNDGLLDLFSVNGSTFQDEKDPSRLVPMKNQLFWLKSPEEGYFEVGKVSGAVFQELHVGRGAAFADYDNDGDIDVFVVNHNDRPLLLRNDGGNKRNWLKVRLRPTKSNRSGFGTVVQIEAQRIRQYQEIGSQPSYLSQNALEAHFGLGHSRIVDRLSVRFPSGIVRELQQLPVNQIVVVSE